MVIKLLEDSRRKFIWAEISFFSLWWKEISDDTKEKVKLLLSRKQLEFVTGGWVMNDEANAHYYSILQQLTHGHQWLLTNLNVRPRYGWAIDPFGHSPTMPYFYKKLGLEALVMHRTHYSVKKFLASNKQLEFRWRQLFDTKGTSDFLSHMFPFYGYDIPHTCGPHPEVCCQFDFKRLPGQGVTCPWKVPPQPITENNLVQRADMLLDQYRKKAQLYSTNVVLVPLGDDFRYVSESEWDAQYNNYQKLFDYMNNNPAMNIEAKFGTLTDYFSAIAEERSVDQFPSLSGDFFTYADRDDHYWSGYYTSRPFYKRMDRELQAYVRSADLILTLAWMEAMKLTKSEEFTSFDANLVKRIYNARSSLSLFQHHDGVTGTAKKHVVKDYAEKLLAAIQDCQHVIQQASHYLLSPNKESYHLSPDVQFFNLDDTRKISSSVSEQTITTFSSNNDSRRIVFFNSLSHNRHEVVFLKVASADVKVKDWKGNFVPSEVSPLCELTDIYRHCYQLAFVAEVEPLGLATYFIEQATPEDINRSSRVQVKVINSGRILVSEIFKDWVKEFDSEKEFLIQNDKMSVAFSSSGLLKAITFKNSGTTVPLNLEFVKYNARPGRERSGAYLFLPDGEAETLRFQLPLILVFEGPIVSKVVVQLPNIVHSIILCNSPSIDGLGLEIQNLVDISSVNMNYELAMRISSNIDNGDIFYTDLNGLQIIKRKRFSKLPLQANFYPMPSTIFIEDGLTRLTLLSAQPLGAASLKRGQIEVMQDRRLLQDDNRGLDEGVIDNKPVLTLFRLLVEEHINDNCEGEGHLSISAHISLMSLNHPFHHLLWSGDQQAQLLSTYSAVTSSPGVDIHIVSLTTLTHPEVSAGIVLHRIRVDQCVPVHKDYVLTNGQVNVSSLLPMSVSGKMIHSSLTFIETGQQQVISNPLSICTMDMMAVLIPKIP